MSGTGGPSLLCVGRGMICQRLGDQVWVLCVGERFVRDYRGPSLGSVGRERISQRLGDLVWVVWVGRQFLRDWGTTSGLCG